MGAAAVAASAIVWNMRSHKDGFKELIKECAQTRQVQNETERIRSSEHAANWGDVFPGYRVSRRQSHFRIPEDRCIGVRQVRTLAHSLAPRIGTLECIGTRARSDILRYPALVSTDRDGRTRLEGAGELPRVLRSREEPMHARHGLSQMYVARNELYHDRGIVSVSYRAVNRQLKEPKHLRVSYSSY